MVARKRKVFQLPELCLKDLIERRNVACVMKQTIADWYLLQYNRKDQQVMNMIPDNFYSTMQMFALAPGSPYRQKFEYFYLLIRESGLTERWKVQLTEYVTGRMKIVDLETIEKKEIIHSEMLLIYIVSVGLGSSFVVFSGELLMFGINKYSVGGV